MKPFTAKYLHGPDGGWDFIVDGVAVSHAMDADLFLACGAPAGVVCEDLTTIAKKLGVASFHYADDSCKEWGSARDRENEAKAIATELRDVWPDIEPILKSINARNLASV